MGKNNWIGKATKSIAARGTKGKCTPITKPGCTGRAKALAKTFKKMARNRKKEYGGEFVPEEYLSGGEISGIGAGLSSAGSALSMIPGVGAGLSVVGGLVGMLGQGKAQKEAIAEQDKETEKYNTAVRKEYMSGLGSSSNATGSVYAMGGPIGLVPAEVERGEVMQTPGGRLQKVKGAKHSQGGVNVERPDGTIVFSDTLKAPCGKTFATKASEIMKQMKQYEKLLA